MTKVIIISIIWSINPNLNYLDQKEMEKLLNMFFKTVAFTTNLNVVFFNSKTTFR